jgi:hypothetical protein
MFTPEERDRVRKHLLECAQADRRITGAAITGSAAAGREDNWSDIDLAFGIRNTDELQDAVSDWTARMYEEHSAVHHVDLAFGAWLYRVFLLGNTLQVDLAFTPEAEFRALAPTFRLIFGQAAESRHLPLTPPEELIGLAWLHALHARTCIARKRFWQAEFMISGARDNALALACLRRDLPSVHGRGVDMLPTEVRATFEESLVRELTTTELSRAFRAVTDGLLSEIRVVDLRLAERLRPVLTRLTETSH